MARNSDYYDSGAQEALENLNYQEQLTLAEITASKAGGYSCKDSLLELANIRAQRRELNGMQSEYAQSQQPAQRQESFAKQAGLEPEDILRMVQKSKHCEDMTMDELANTVGRVSRGLSPYDPEYEKPKKSPFSKANKGT